MKKKLKNEDAMFAKHQRDWQRQVQKFMIKGIQLHEKITNQPMISGMQETLLFSIMWIEFVEAYKNLSPSTLDADVDFLKHMFAKVMEGDIPFKQRWQDGDGYDVGPAENLYKKHTIN